MDRLDYLLRDSSMAGVPYGNIDLNYLLNNIKISPNHAVGVSCKALAAAEHFLFARMAMHRSVYYHKTTYAFKEACRQLLKRLRSSSNYENIPKDGSAILEMCKSTKFYNFNDGLIDKLIRDASSDETNHCIKTLASCIAARKPPKLIREVSGLYDGGISTDPCEDFSQKCKYELKALAEELSVDVGQFLVCSPKPIKLEDRGSHFTYDEARQLSEGDSEREELIKVFVDGEDEPKSIVDIRNSLIGHCSNHVFKIQRLYLADATQGADDLANKARERVRDWE